MLKGEDVPEPPKIEEIFNMMLIHLEMLIEEKGEKRAVFEMRKHVGWYMKGRPHATEIRRKVNRITSEVELRQLLKEAGEDIDKQPKIEI